MKNWIKVSALAAILSSSMTWAEANKFAALEQKFSNSLSLDISAIADSPVPGLVQMETNRGIIYASDNGQFVILGNVFNVDEGLRNETEEAMSAMRVEGVKEFTQTGIEFKAENERYVVNVFTDITCSFCRQLHDEMGKYNDLGITVRYLAWPRAGVNSKTYQDMVSVWCADDPKQAMTDAKNGRKIAQISCANDVDAQYLFGRRVGVSGTPYIVLPDGSLIGGYQPAAVLLRSLQQSIAKN